AQNLYYRWSKEFLEAGKKRLAGDTAREASSDEVKQLRTEARQLKEALAEVTLENRLLKKSVIADGEDGESGTPHPTSLRSSEPSRPRICGSGARSTRSAFPRPPSTPGSTAMPRAASTRWKTASQGRSAS